jgi:hypothetical protein
MAKRRAKRRHLASVLALLAAAGLATAGATASASAEGSGTKAQCAAKILKPPSVVKAEMFNPGKIHQETLFEIHVGAVTGCDNWRRVTKGRPQVKRDGRWINSLDAIWSPVGIEGDTANEAHNSGWSVVPTTHIFERRVNGHWEPARFEVRNVMETASTRKVVAKGRIKYVPIKIVPGK